MVSDRARAWLPRLWAVALASLLLGPALRPGFVLSYDMVWVPDLAFRPDFLGLGSGLPRAVPSDAVVALLDELVPGMLLQKVVLVGCLVAGGLGAARWTRDSLVARLVAVGVYQWNPFVAERLLLGHWPVLLAYAALPWVALHAREVRRSGRLSSGLAWAVLVGSLSASAGLMTAVAATAFAFRRGGGRANLHVALLLVATQAPWLVSGLVHAAQATTASVGARVFALQDVGRVPGPVAALGLGGVWNSEVVLPSRTGVGGLLAVVLPVALAAVGARSWARRCGRRDAGAFLVCWAVGWGAAVLTWLAPGATGWMVSHVPGTGLLRDGSRLLGLCAPLLATAAAEGAALVTRRLPTVARPGLATALVLLPVALLPDASFGLSHRLRPVDYPASWAELRRTVAAEHEAGAAGDVLVLPFTSYRAPDWNHHHKVLDPLGRFLTPDHVTADDLVVSGRRVAGEDPRGPEVRSALAAGDPATRSRALAALGIGLVVADLGAPGDAPAVAGRSLAAPPDFRVTKITRPDTRSRSAVATAAIAVAWLGFAASVLLASALSARSARSVRKAARRASVRRSHD